MKSFLVVVRGVFGAFCSGFSPYSPVLLHAPIADGTELVQCYNEVMMYEKVLRFARSQGYSSIHRLKRSWRGYEVYEPIFKKGVVSHVGLPLVILANESEVRMSSPEESLECL